MKSLMTHNRKLSLPLLLVIIIIISLSCSYTSMANDNAKTASWNDLAHYLAGLEITQGNILRKKSEAVYYKKHAAYMNTFWDYIRQDTINPIKPWQQKHVPASLFEQSTVFYPLSGADFINMFSLFPSSPAYIMIGLEQPGPAPDPMRLHHWQLERGLLAIQRIISQYGRFNYFATHAMHKEMNNAYLSGTTPVLMIFMARLGIKIINVEQVGIDRTTGMLRETDNRGLLDGTNPAVNGVRISFLSPGDDHPKTLIYLRMYLNNYSVSMHSASGKFLQNQRHIKTMMKSAIYLLHLQKYSLVRDFILNHSDLIIQDDSGIPYKCLDNRTWDITLFGKYFPVEVKGIGTIIQWDMQHEYRKKSYPLPFKYGYGATLRKQMSNLQLAIKKEKQG